MKLSVIKNDKPIIKNSLSKLKPLRTDSLWAYHPCVVEFKNKYYLFYTGKSLGIGIKHHMLLAKSPDLSSWRTILYEVLPKGEKGSWDSDFIAHGYVFPDRNMFYMLYDGSKKGRWLEEIGVAWSNNLIDWKKYRSNPIFKVGKNWWEREHVSRCFLFKDKGFYYLYYAGHDGKRERIGLARGKGLFSLARFLKTPVLDVGREGAWDEKSVSDPRVIGYKGFYLMFYSGIDRRGVEQTGVAVSKDLIRWDKYRGNPILDVSKNGWDSISAARVDVKIINEEIYIFYSGRKNFFYSIGMAKLQIKL